MYFTQLGSSENIIWGKEAMKIYFTNNNSNNNHGHTRQMSQALT